jgi:hypothetical protein
MTMLGWTVSARSSGSSMRLVPEEMVWVKPWWRTSEALVPPEALLQV